jgi:hypothetical protein
MAFCDDHEFLGRLGLALSHWKKYAFLNINVMWNCKVVSRVVSFVVERFELADYSTLALLAWSTLLLSALHVYPLGCTGTAANSEEQIRKL